jgi:hypothetical protein
MEELTCVLHLKVQVYRLKQAKIGRIPREDTSSVWPEMAGMR